MTPSNPEWRRRKAANLKGALERRTFGARSLELRESADGPRLHGYAAVFSVRYPMGSGTWSEVVAPTAFTRTLSESPDVVLLLGHGHAASGLPLARTTAGTLRLAADDHGLAVDASLDPEDPDVQLLTRKLNRGDLDGQMSMAFRTTQDSWSEDGSLRTPKSVNLAHGDVSIVTHAASPTTSATIRSHRGERARRERMDSMAFARLRAATVGVYLLEED